MELRHAYPNELTHAMVGVNTTAQNRLYVNGCQLVPSRGGYDVYYGGKKVAGPMSINEAMRYANNYNKMQRDKDKKIRSITGW